MRSQKGSHKIVVNAIEYRWRATGNDGWISVGIWPANNVGPFIGGKFRYHETWVDVGSGRKSSMGDQLVITNRIVRRVIEHATATHGYNPQVAGSQLNLGSLEDVVQWDDAIRGSRRSTSQAS